ncbi:uncharacterized protein PV09_08108 [Verruconis gallopava]|uniref:RING-type E3 ubiquitin transferase n=1 Tax=Verruconis gallopava TaxID=253628 RepID=A0A0D2AMP8_9PEZI|nr:uncharacterized protein PV09_08108 [Verruconis gallopava]KIW00399.1 hypothetical protein PV09_08108 [Verruconis gallopava]
MTAAGDTNRTAERALEVKTNSADPRDHCAICLESISERAITAPCNHALFDYLCLLTWLLDHDARCPLCKTEVVSVSYDFVSTTEFKTFIVPKKPPPTSSRSLHDRHDSPGDQSRTLSRSRRRQRPASNLPSDSDRALETRRSIYCRQLYSLHVGSNSISGHRNFTARTFSASLELQSRARIWIRRELGVFDFLNSVKGPNGATRRVNNAEFLLEYIIAMLKSVDIKDCSGRAEHILGEFLGKSNARLFLHELEAWLRSPYCDVREWDAVVQYPDL